MIRARPGRRDESLRQPTRRLEAQLTGRADSRKLESGRETQNSRGRRWAIVPVRDLTGREQAYGVQVEAGLAYEFLITLTAFGLPEEQETYEIGVEWFESIRTKASKPLLQALGRMGEAVGKAWVNLVGLATVSPATPDVPSFLRRAEDLDPLELRLYLLGFHVPHYRQSITGEVLLR